MQQHVQPNSVESTFWGERLVTWAVSNLPQHVGQRLDQLPHRTLVMVLVAFVSLSSASCMRSSGASRRRRKKPDNKNLWGEKFVPLKYTEQDEPDAEPKGDLGHATSYLSGTSTRQSSHPVVPLKALMPKHPVPSTDDEPEDEDCTRTYCWAAPGTLGFVAQQTAEVECVVQIFRMNTEGHVHLVDEERMEQKRRESQNVPNRFVRSCTLGLERKIQQNPLRSNSRA